VEEQQIIEEPVKDVEDSTEVALKEYLSKRDKK